MVPQDTQPAAPALARTDVLVLCGGLGTRLRTVVADRPKGLAEISGRPFLDLLAGDLVRQGAGRIVLCTGFGAEQIAAHFRARGDAEYVVSAEPAPLGTGGALRHALPAVKSDPVIAVNGDSFCAVDYGALLAFHARKGGDATLVVAPADERRDVGAITLDADGRLLSFAEKPAGSELRGWINAGIYVLQRAFLQGIPAQGAVSLEKAVFPAAVAARRCYGFPVEGPVVDIGTPERFTAAQHLLR